MFKKIMPLACMAMLFGAALTQQASANPNCADSCKTEHPICRDSLVTCNTTAWVQRRMDASKECREVEDVTGRHYNRTGTKSWCMKHWVKKRVKCVVTGRKMEARRDRFGRRYFVTLYKHKRETVAAGSRTYKKKCDIQSHRRGSGTPPPKPNGGGMYTIDESLQSIGAPLPQQPIIQLVPYVN